MKAIILAAGYATRLYPLTLNQPKPLLKVGGKPMMERIIDKINSIKEVDVIYVVTNNKFFSHFNDWADNFKSEKTIKTLSDQTMSNDDRLGALGDIKFVIDKENLDEDIIVFGGDNLFEEELSPIHSLFKEKGSSIVLFNDVKDIEIAKRMGVASLDDSKKITEFVEKPPEPKSTLAATCVYFLKKDDLPLIDECLKSKGGEGEVKAGDLIAYMIEKTDVYGYVLKKKWFDIGNLDQLKEADEYWKGK